MSVDTDDQLARALDRLGRSAPIPTTWPELGEAGRGHLPNRPHSRRRATALVVAAAAIVVVAVVIALARQPGAPQSRSVAAPVTMSGGRPSTSPPPTTGPGSAPSGAVSSTQAAADLVDAWRAQDREAAARVADTTAVEGIFAVPVTTAWVRGCTTDASLAEGTCVYRTANGVIQLQTERRSTGWVVSAATFEAPSAGGSHPSQSAPGQRPSSTA